MSDEKPDKPSPAYIPWRTFGNFIKSLRETRIPTQVNRSLMNNLSYSTQAQLLAALRFLELIDSQGTPQPMLSRIVDASEKDEGSVIKELIERRYAFVFSSLDLERVTTEEIERQFRQEGITGSTVTRAVAFFLGAAEAAGFTLSPHLKKRTKSGGTVSAPRQRRANRKRMRSGGGSANIIPPPPPPTSTDAQTMEEQLLDKFPALDNSWGEELKKLWFQDFKELMGMVKGRARNTRRAPSSS
jgi:hypothetical protein